MSLSMSVFETFQYKGLEAIRVGRFNAGVSTTFILYRLGATLIDTGPSNQWKFVKPFVQQKPLQQLILTHHHEDHSGNAASIKRLTGVTPIAPPLTVEKLRKGFPIPLIQRFMWGSAGRVDTTVLPEVLTLSDGDRATAVFCPGHAKDMTCYLLPDRGWLFSADLYIANHLKLMRIDEHLPTLLNSTKQALDCDFDTIICPHRGIVEQGKQRLQEKYDFLINLAGEVQTLQAQGRSIESIMVQILGKETLLSKLNGYNFSKINLIRSCLDVPL